MKCSPPLLPALLFFLILSGSAPAQTLSNGIIDPSRAIDWTHAGVVGGIPDASWPTCNTLGVGGQSSSYSQSVTGSQINSALSTCASSHPSGSVVYLNPGTYTISTGIQMKSYTVLRGAGANQTLLVVPSGGYSGTGCNAIVCFTSDSGTWTGSSTVQPGGSNAATWTSGFTQGTTQIVLSSVGSSGLSVGQWIILDQANVTTPAGNMFFCDANPATCALQPGNGMRAVAGVDHGIAQMVQITACSPSCTSGSTFTISPGLYGQNWSSSLNPGAWWPNSVVQYAGIENVAIDDRLDTGNSSSINVAFFNSANDWETGCATYLPGRSHSQTSGAAHITVANNYRWGTKNATSSSYGDESYLTSDDLIVNNIYQQVSSPQMTQLDTGTVRAYNYDILDLYCDDGGSRCNSPSGAPGTTPGSALGTTTTNHNPAVMDVLWEGNITPGYKSDDIHGSGAMSTYFRNQVYGWSAGSANANGFWNWAFAVLSYNRALNIVGNVIGKPGYASVYQGTDTTSEESDGEIYDLGWGDGVANDSAVASTMLRWANWDAVTNATRFCGSSADPDWSTICGSTSELPTAIGTYQSAAPTVGDIAANQAPLPKSFAFASTPTWWPSGKPWPPIGPDLTGGNVLVCTSGTYNGYLVTSSSQCTGGTSTTALNGMVNSIPAMDCYLNTMGGPPDGSGPILSFNASACYGSSSVPVPSPPTGLSAVVN